MWGAAEGTRHAIAGVGTPSMLKSREEMAPELRRPPSAEDTVNMVLDISTLGPGQYFGERALLDKGDHTASIVTITPTIVFTLSKYDFYHQVDVKSQQMMQAYAKKFYPDEFAIRRQIDQQYQWVAYKNKLFGEVAAAPPHPFSPRGGRGASPRKEKPTAMLPALRR